MFLQHHIIELRPSAVQQCNEADNKCVFPFLTEKYSYGEAHPFKVKDVYIEHSWGPITSRWPKVILNINVGGTVTASKMHESWARHLHHMNVKLKIL